MNFLDVFIIIPLIWAIYKGFKKGLIFEVATLIALVAGVYFGSKLAIPFSNYISANLNTASSTSTIISFITIFIAVVILVFLMGKIIEGVINLISLGLFNKLLGAAFGIIKVTLFLSFILYGIDSLNDKIEFIPESVKNHSVLYKPVSSFSSFILTMV